MNYYVINHWRTAASAYPRARIGDWAVGERKQDPGQYRMQGVGSFYYHAEPLNLTVLTEGDTVWFTDEPRQVYALAEIGLFRARGDVVVGGLGLGLIHHFLAMNPSVRSVTTIERAKELRTLVWPHVDCGQLITGDFYDVLPTLNTADTIILDFIFGYQGERAWKELEAQRDFCREHFPVAQFLEHGYQRQMDEETVTAAIPPSAFGEAMYDQVKIVR